MENVISTQEFNINSHKHYPAINFAAESIHKFIAWCCSQDKNWFLWLGITLIVGIGTVLPLTFFAIVCGSGNDFTLWIIACVINVPVFIVNLAGQPTKVTLPALFFAWFVDASIIAYCAVLFLIR